MYPFCTANAYKSIMMMMIRKRCQTLFLFSFVLIAIIILKKFNFQPSNVNYNVQRYLTNKSLHLHIKRHLLKALRYSRSQIVKKELMEVLSLMSEEIKVENSEIKWNRIKEINQSGQLFDVCLEEHLGAIDHPLYNLGQVDMKCNKRPFEDVLTFIVSVESCKEISDIVGGIRTSYNKSRIILLSLFSENCDLNVKKNNVEILKGNIKTNDVLKIVERITTPYILWAPNIYHFDNQSKIERLVQMVSYTDIEIASGGVRLEDGRFSTACYQMGVKMYTLKLIEGYDMSFNSCMYCDYSPAPFVTRTSFFIEILKQKTNSQNNVLMLEIFTDLFISKRGQFFVCPDVMFHVKQYDLSFIERILWFDFVSKFELNRIIFPSGQDINFTCSESRMSCYKEKGLMIPLCCMKELSDSLKFMNNLLTKANVTFEVLEGTVMGGVKYKNILFWERDADTNFRVQMIDKLEEKLDDIRKQGYSMKLYYECPFRRDHEKCRQAGWHGSIYYAFRTDNWRTEMYGVTFILSDFRGKLKNPTKIFIDGNWYITYTNPALYGRNIYGGDIFQHIEHYSALGISHKEYKNLFKGNFAKCPRPGFHGCLDNFVGEGNLQFLDIYI